MAVCEQVLKYRHPKLFAVLSELKSGPRTAKQISASVYGTGGTKRLEKSRYQNVVKSISRLRAKGFVVETELKNNVGVFSLAGDLHNGQ